MEEMHACLRKTAIPLVCLLPMRIYGDVRKERRNEGRRQKSGREEREKGEKKIEKGQIEKRYR